jgi:hypothetical protein
MSVIDEFFDYLKTPLDESVVNELYKKNNVVHIRMQTYGEFIGLLIQKCFDTYLGDDVTDQEGRLHHFNWCWNKTATEFKSQNIYLGVCIDAKLYFKNFMFEVFYNAEDKEYSVNQLKTQLFWRRIFDISSPKTKADMECMLSVYKLFDDSIKEKLVLND